MDNRGCAWLLLCWASLCSAQPTRASFVDGFDEGAAPADTNGFTTIVSAHVNSDPNKYPERVNVWNPIVTAAHTGGNPYESMSTALARLGISTNRAANYQSKFGISLQVQSVTPIGGGAHALMAEDNQAAVTVPAEAGQDSDMQTLLNEAKAMLGAATGGYPMVMIDQPVYQADSAPVVLLAQSNTSQQSVAGNSHVIGECRVVNVGEVEEGYGVSGLAPVSTADIFFRGPYAKEIDWQAATVTVIQQPQHGEVEITTSSLTGSLDAVYRSERGYTGNDALVLKVEGTDYSLEIHYFFRVVDYKSSSDEIFENPNCKAAEWTISATMPQEPYMLASDALTNYFLKDVSISLQIASLTNGAVGETIGHNVTLDDNGGGYGWFIDSTPDSNEEFLATSNPNEWIAKTGSEAAGKMDLLTVLLHEYGHALGLDHSADTHDFMAEELQPGVRRTVSDADMAKLWSLLSEPVMADASTGSATGMGDGSDTSAPLAPLSSLGLSFFFGFARRRVDVSSGQGITLPPLTGGDPNAITVTPQVTVNNTPQQELATHTGVYNGDFAQADTTASQYGWNTRGNVSLSSGAAEITESERTLSGFSQAFVLPADVRAVRFTIEAAQFTANGAAPPDAFEVALLDSVTGLPVVGTVSLTHSDALFNLQSNGTLTTASGVTVNGLPNNTNGLLSLTNPITVTVDVSQVPTGTSLKLYFDLLGLGAKGSRVVIDDVKLLTSLNTAPVAVDDSAIAAGVAPIRISVLANDTDAESDPLTPTLVTNATHGVNGADTILRLT